VAGYDEALDGGNQVAQFMLTFLMVSFKYRCPQTGRKVHGRAADDLISAQRYEPVACTACGHTHLVNLKTGETTDYEWVLPPFQEWRRIGTSVK